MGNRQAADAIGLSLILMAVREDCATSRDILSATGANTVRYVAHQFAHLIADTLRSQEGDEEAEKIIGQLAAEALTVAKGGNN